MCHALGVNTHSFRIECSHFWQSFFKFHLKNFWRIMEIATSTWHRPPLWKMNPEHIGSPYLEWNIPVTYVSHSPYLSVSVSIGIVNSFSATSEFHESRKLLRKRLKFVNHCRYRLVTAFIKRLASTARRGQRDTLEQPQLVYRKSILLGRGV